MPNAKTLYENVQRAVAENGKTSEVVTVEEKIMAYGVISTPALVVDGQVKFSAKLRQSVKSWECYDDATVSEILNLNLCIN